MFIFNFQLNVQPLYSVIQHRLQKIQKNPLASITNTRPRMSQNQLSHATSSEHIMEKQDPILDNTLSQQVINNSVFRMMLKDMVEEMFARKNEQESRENQIEPRVSVDGFIDEIGDSLVLIAQNQASNKIRDAEKFLAQMFQLKLKEISDRLEAIVDNKLKQIEEKLKEIKQIEQRTRNESGFLSPVRPALKGKQAAQASFTEHLNKRMQLKQKILNSSFIPQVRHSVNVQSLSMLSQSLNDASFQRLSQKIKTLEQSLKVEIKAQNTKINTLRAQIKTDIEQYEENVKEQMNGGFEGIWNVISNLEKRMII